MTELTKIANKYSTDKGTMVLEEENVQGAVHGYMPHHCYTEFYDFYFNKYRDKNPVIVEIGVAEGGSIQMINEYFNSKCTIFAVDIDINCSNVTSFGDNISFIQCDQGNINNLIELRNFFIRNNIEVDILIDDGSHRVNHQMKTFYFLHEIISKDGIYIIEDVQCCYDRNYNENINDNSYSIVSFFERYTNYYDFPIWVNEYLHNRIQNTILFTSKDSNDISIGKTLIVTLK